jgi:hypothetical protein
MWAWLAKVTPPSARFLLQSLIAALLIGIACWHGLHANEFALDWPMIVLLLSAVIVVTLLPVIAEKLRAMKSFKAFDTEMVFGFQDTVDGALWQFQTMLLEGKAPIIELGGRKRFLGGGRGKPLAFDLLAGQAATAKPGAGEVSTVEPTEGMIRAAVPDLALETSIWELAAVDKRSGFLRLAAEIEKELFRLRDAHVPGEGTAPTTLRELVTVLEAQNILPPQAAKAVHMLPDIRNAMVHLRPRELDAGVGSVIDSGMDLLRLLKALPRPEGA